MELAYIPVSKTGFCGFKSRHGYHFAVGSTTVTITGGVWANRLADLAEILEKFDMDMN